MTYCLQDEEEGEGHTLSREQEGRKEGERHHTEFSQRAKEKVSSRTAACSREGRKEGRGRLL